MIKFLASGLLCGWICLGAPAPLLHAATPGIVSDFEKALIRGDYAVAMSEIRIPLEVVETAYEPGDGWCAPHYQKQVVSSTQKVEKILVRLRAAWSKGKMVQGSNPAYYGVVGEGDCEHFWAIKLDPSMKKIVGLVIDASDNVWTASRKEFNLTGLPE